MSTIIHYNHVDTASTTGNTRIDPTQIDYGTPEEDKQRTYAIITNFDSKHGNEAWYSISQPQLQQHSYGKQHEDWREQIQQALEMMLEQIVKHLELEKLRNYVEVNTTTGMYGFNIDFWYESHKPEQKLSVTHNDREEDPKSAKPIQAQAQQATQQAKPVINRPVIPQQHQYTQHAQHAQQRPNYNPNYNPNAGRK